MAEQIIELLREKKLGEVRKRLEKMNEADVAELLEELNIESILPVFRMLPKDIAAEVFSHLSGEQKKKIVQSITEHELKHILDELFFDDRIDMMEEMPANMVKRILAGAKEDERRLINQFLNYPEDSAGSIMTIEYVDLKKHMTVGEALKHIRKIGMVKETIYTCYILDYSRKLEGIISLRGLVTSDPDAIIEDVMEKNVIYVHTHDDQEMVADLFKKYDFMAIPVVDKEGRLTGIITIDDIVDVIEEENTEDFHRMAAIAPSTREYFEESVFSLARHRTTWLLVLMISATFTGRIIQRFEDVLQSVVVLTAFIPMLMDTGGNAGSQSSTLIIRGLALGEIKAKDILRVISKELGVSTLIGIVLAVVNFLRIYYIEKMALDVSLTVTGTLFFTIVLAKVVGAILPIIANQFKMDPAIMAGPLITTIVDAFSLVLYFSLAVWILGI